MIARLLVATLCASVLFAACGPERVPRSDGGVALCEPGQVQTLPVLVRDSVGDPVPDATITAKNVGSGKTVTAVTNADGTSGAVTSAIGSGTIQLSAVKAAKPSEIKQAEALCGECGCSFTPDSITLTLNP